MDDIGKDDFLLGIQTEFQRDIMMEFGNNIICIDATHNTNMYDFYLITIVVVDEFGEGIPVGWVLSNREDGCILTQFFKNIHKRTGELMPNIFMSDDAEQCWNSWSAIYRNTKTKKLLCKWQIDRAWRKGLAEHVSKQEDRIKIYHYLQILLAEHEEPQFRILLQQLLSSLTLHNPEFYQYFQRYYCKHLQEWAVCYRKWAFINTNMFVEAFHHNLKDVYLDKKHN